MVENPYPSFTWSRRHRLGHSNVEDIMNTGSTTKFVTAITLLLLTAVVICYVYRQEVGGSVSLTSLFQLETLKTKAYADYAAWMNKTAANDVVGVPRPALVPFTVDEMLYIMGDVDKNDTVENRTTWKFERNAAMTSSFVHRMTGDERYLGHIRTQIVRPMPDKPININLTAQVGCSVRCMYILRHTEYDVTLFK